MPVMTASPSYLEQIMERVAYLLALVPNIDSISPLAPRHVTRFPTTIVNAGTATHTKGSGQKVTVRELTIILLVGSAQANLQMQLEAATLPLIDAIGDIFIKHPDLILNGGDALVQRSWLSKDTGAQTLTYAGNSYIGSLLTLTVNYVTMGV